jgi:crotonobetainyl-CoA:carnitine CoA-transferase CaiB-like acyl-CoA transferase
MALTRSGPRVIALAQYGAGPWGAMQRTDLGTAAEAVLSGYGVSQDGIAALHAEKVI